jgi:hypothetical protein
MFVNWPRLSTVANRLSRLSASVPTAPPSSVIVLLSSSPLPPRAPADERSSRSSAPAELAPFGPSDLAIVSRLL